MNRRLKSRLARTSFFTTAATLALSGMALAQTGEGPVRNYPYYHGPGMMWGGGQWGGFGMFLGPVFMILIIAAIVVGVVYLLRQTGVAGSPSSQVGERALALLKERYAKGEIDSKEFDERKARLMD